MKNDGTLVWAAALMPTNLLAEFQAAISGLLPLTVRSAKDFVDLALALEPPHRHQG
jgi:hypothetical protein